LAEGPLVQGAEKVAEMDIAGWLDKRKCAGHVARLTKRGRIGLFDCWLGQVKWRRDLRRFHSGVRRSVRLIAAFDSS
jgi:hypothetical protein